jgi:hypothetical protein
LPSLGSIEPAHQRSCSEFLESCSFVQPTKSVLHVDGRGGALEDTKGPDDGRLHAVLRLVDLEVAQRALGLSSPVLAGVDLELAESIALGSGVGGHDASGCEGAGVVQSGERGLLGDKGGTGSRAKRRGLANGGGSS